MNHFPRSFEITRKDCLYKRLSRMQVLHGQRHFAFVPKTYILPNESSLLAEDLQREKHRMWIAKPAASSQGKGIYFITHGCETKTAHRYIASHYVDSPLLINGYKFDLRIYVAITSINPLRIYMYEEGLVRFATVKYTRN